MAQQTEAERKAGMDLQADQGEELLTPKELAARLKVPLSWIYERTRDRYPGSIPQIRCCKYIRFRLSEVLKWLDQEYGKKQGFDEDGIWRG